MLDSSLVGRKVEVDLLAELIRNGGARVITGPAGIGKSALLHHVEQTARKRGMQVLSATGLQAETHLPFAGLLQLLGPTVDGLDNLPPPQRDALRAAFGVIDAPAPNRFLLALGTLNLLTDAGADPGLVALAEA